MKCSPSRSLPRSLIPAAMLAGVLSSPLPGPAADTGVGLNANERALLALASQGLSLMAVAVASEGCGALARDYRFDAEIRHDGTGAARIDDHRFTLATVSRTDRDTTFATASAGAGEVADTLIRNLDGVFVHLATSDRVFADTGLETVPSGGEPERHHAALVEELGAPAEDRVHGRGADVVTAPEPPPVGWTHRVEFRRPLRELGSLAMTRRRGATAEAPACVIRLADAFVDNLAGGLQSKGTVTVRVAP